MTDWPSKVTHSDLTDLVDGYDHREHEYSRPELRDATFHLVRHFPLTHDHGTAATPKALTDDMEHDSAADYDDELHSNLGLQNALLHRQHTVPPLVIQKHHPDPTLDGAHRKALGLNVGLTHHPAYVTDAKPAQRKQAAHDGDVWWHGTASGDLRGGEYGLHVGTHRAATEALTARIGHPVHGEWDGTRRYGDTLLAGQKTLRERGEYPSGHNVKVPEHDHYPDPKGHFPHDSHVTPDSTPHVFPLRIHGPMANEPHQAVRDDEANEQMRHERGHEHGRGIYYRNVGEDAGSVSAALPHRNHITAIPRGQHDVDYHSADRHTRELRDSDYAEPDFDDDWDGELFHHHGMVTIASGPNIEHVPTEWGGRIFADEPGQKGSQLEYNHDRDGRTTYGFLPSSAPQHHRDALVGELHAHHPDAVDREATRKEPEPEAEPTGPFFHGTTSPLRGYVRPAAQHGRHVTFPHDTSTAHAYATSSEDDAWHYAHKAWSNSDSGHPRVYEVAPTGPHEKDPQFEGDRSRSNFAGDRRSQHPWKIVREVPMPEHMGTPRDWDPKARNPKKAAREPGSVDCWVCGASGHDDAEGMECGACDGSGYLTPSEQREVGARCPCGEKVRKDTSGDLTHLDGSVSHDDGESVSQKMRGQRTAARASNVWYHGTTTRHLPGIRAHGLDHPHLTTSPEDAEDYAHAAAFGTGADPVVLRVDRPSTKHHRYDGMAMASPPSHRDTPDEPAPEEKTWQRSRDDVGAVFHDAVIPPEKVTLHRHIEAEARRRVASAGLSFDYGEQETGGSKFPTHSTLTAVHPEHGEVGKLTYWPPRRSNGKLKIDRLEIDPDHRRQGHGSALMDEVQRRHPKASIDHGDRTNDGKAWWDSYGQGRSDSRGRTAGLAPDETPSARIFGPTHGLDHRLFDGEQLKAAVRDDLMRKWYEFCEAQGLYDPDEWSIVYFAGSEASEWTSANREGNNDFDVLVGVDLHLFATGGYGRERMRRAEHLGWEPTQAGIAAGITDKLKTSPGMVDPSYRVPGDDSDWDQTWYVNPGSYHIADIKPYAAYDVTHDRWAVKPPHLPGWSMADFPEGPGLEQFCWGFEHLVRATLEMPEPYRHQEGYALWHYVHDTRSEAFGPQGEGWYDPRNVLEKWLDQKGLMQELWTLMHEAAEDPHLLDAPPDWNNTPVLAHLLAFNDPRWPERIAAQCVGPRETARLATFG